MREDRLLEHVDRYTWLTESTLQDAGCVTVVTASAVTDVADAFGIDLSSSPDEGRAHLLLEWHFAQVVPPARVGGPVTVVQHNGFEGSRDVVLEAASRDGRAASIFWNVNGLVVFSCAERGRVLFSEELMMVEEADLARLPTDLVPYARVAAEDDDVDEADEVDLVALGAAMVAVFVGSEFGPEVLTEGTWHELTAHVERPRPAEVSPLRSSHADLADAFERMPSDHLRPLAHVLAHLVVRHASMAEDDVVTEVLVSVTRDAPGTMTERFEAAQRQWTKDSDVLWSRQAVELEADGATSQQEEERGNGRRLWVGRAMQYAVHADAAIAASGLAYCAVHVLAMDDREAADILSRLCATPPEGWGIVLASLPRPLTAADRERALERERAAIEDARQAEAESWEWGGLRPTARMRDAGPGVRSLAWTDPTMLEDVLTLPADELRPLAVWVARRVLTDAGLIDRPWSARQVAVLGTPDAGGDDRTAELTWLFGRLGADADLERRTSVGPDGEVQSMPHMALPAVFGANDPDALSAACGVLSDADVTYAAGSDAFFAEVRARFGLPRT